MSRAWFPFYVADYLADTGHLTASEHGAYLLLIMHYWSNGGLPSDDSRLARIARMDAEEWQASRDVISDFFGEGWSHKRIDAELAKADEISSKRRASAMQKHSKCSANAVQKHTQSQSQSQDSSNELSKRAILEKAQDCYRVYPKHVDPRAAEKKFISAVKSGEDADRIIAAAKRYAAAHRAAGTEKQFIPAPAVWLNKGGWLSEDLPQASAGQVVAFVNPFDMEAQQRRIREEYARKHGIAI